MKQDAGNADWQSVALCAQVDPEAWFPAKGGNLRVQKWICSRCPVRDACLAYALEHRIVEGVWGGLSWSQRRPLLRREVA